jgi:hypothetical protein
MPFEFCFHFKSSRNSSSANLPSSTPRTEQNPQQQQNFVAFGEVAMKMLLEFYTKTAGFEEVKFGNLGGIFKLLK